MKEIPMRDFDFIVSPAKLLTPEIVQMVSSIHEHKGNFEVLRSCFENVKVASQKRMDKPSRMRYIIYRQDNILYLR